MLTLLRAVTTPSVEPTPTHPGPDPSEVSNWSPGYVTLPGVGGPYPALIADFLTVEGWAVARFTDDTVRRIATDCDRLAERVGEAAGTARIRPRPTGGFDVIKQAGTAEETVIPITADAENHYLLRGWCWHPTE